MASTSGMFEKGWTRPAAIEGSGGGEWIMGKMKWVTHHIYFPRSISYRMTSATYRDSFSLSKS